MHIPSMFLSSRIARTCHWEAQSDTSAYAQKNFRRVIICPDHPWEKYKITAIGSNNIEEDKFPYKTIGAVFSFIRKPKGKIAGQASEQITYSNIRGKLTGFKSIVDNPNREVAKQIYPTPAEVQKVDTKVDIKA